MFLNKAYPSSYLIFIILASGLASLGTIPYGFQFAQSLGAYHPLLAVVVGTLLGFSAAFANAILGIYSFLGMKTKQNLIKPGYLLLGSLMSAIPIGCMCYFAYQALLPVILNVLITLAVTLINAAIGYTAILNLMLDFKYRPSHTGRRAETLCRVLGFIIGAGVSLTAYVAAIHGLTGLLILGIGEHRKQLAFELACFIGFISWVPFAALFANAMQKTMGKLFQLSEHFIHRPKQFNRTKFLILTIALCSGASFAQIAITFFNPEMNIPALFKLDWIQILISKALVPLAFISSAAVNFIALETILKRKTTLK